MTSLYLEDIFDSEFGSGYGAIVNGVGYISCSFIDDVESQSSSSDEIDMFFESVSNTDLNYEDDFWFAEYCLRTEFLSQSYVMSDLEYDTDLAELQLHNDLFIHSVDPQVGF